MGKKTSSAHRESQTHYKDKDGTYRPTGNELKRREEKKGGGFKEPSDIVTKDDIKELRKEHEKEGSNIVEHDLSPGSSFYVTYKTSDGKYMNKEYDYTSSGKYEVSSKTDLTKEFKGKPEPKKETKKNLYGLI
jgi:hypothetical protein